MTDDEYEEAVIRLCAATADELRQAKGDSRKQREALCRYYRRGHEVGFSAGEMVDFLGVSSPSILEEAGYTDNEAAAAMQLSASLTDDDITGAGG